MERWEGENGKVGGRKSSLCCNRSLPIHVEIIARCGSYRDSKLSGNVCRAVLGGVFFPPSIAGRDRRRQPADCLFGDLGIKRPPGRLSEDLFIIRWQRSRRRVMSIERKSKADVFKRSVTITDEEVWDCIGINIKKLIMLKTLRFYNLITIDSGTQKNVNNYI